MVPWSACSKKADTTVGIYGRLMTGVFVVLIVDPVVQSRAIVQPAHI